MTRIVPADGRLLRRAVADSLVVAADPDAADAAKVYWHRSRPWAESVIKALATLPDVPVAVAGKYLMANPRSREAYREFCSRLDEAAARNSSDLAELFQISWDFECNSRIGYHIGCRFPGGTWGRVSADELIAAHHLVSRKPGDGAAVLIVVPFRGNGDAPWRLRNAVACLCALADQSADRGDYQVVVVESDEKPRWQHVLVPLCDQYIFASKTGSFNKSWAVNVGVRQAHGSPDVVCIIDADALPDREFIQRNVDRFRQPGVQAVLPFREVLWLDAASTEAALSARLIRGAAEPDRSSLRGFVLRRPPGLCMWIRSGIYAAIGGMDERYEGWGGEDTDFTLRVTANAALDRYDDPSLHLYHSPSAVTVNGVSVNSGIPMMSWPKDSDFGRLDRFQEKPPALIAEVWHSNNQPHPGQESK